MTFFPPSNWPINGTGPSHLSSFPGSAGVIVTSTASPIVVSSPPYVTGYTYGIPIGGPEVEPAADSELAKLKDRVTELEGCNRTAVKEILYVHELCTKLRNELDQLKQLLSGLPDTQRSNQQEDYWR